MRSQRGRWERENSIHDDEKFTHPVIPNLIRNLVYLFYKSYAV